MIIFEEAQPHHSTHQAGCHRSSVLDRALGRDASYCYRLHQSLGRFSIVDTSVRDAQKIPVNLVADQKHTWLLGEFMTNC